MALPLFIPAIAKGAAVLSAALGLTALVSSKTDNDEYADEYTMNTSKIKDALDPYVLVKQNIPLMMAALPAREKMQQLTKKNIPTAENALVLKPEYRTESYPSPLNLFGYKPMLSEQNSGESTQQTGTDTSSSGGEAPKPEDDKDKKIKELEEKIKQLESKPKNNGSKNEKGFKKGVQKGWEYTKKVGNVGLQGIGIGLGFSPIIGVPAGIYYGGKALGWWGENSNNSSTEIDREGTEQAWEDMKVGRKPGQ